MRLPAFLQRAIKRNPLLNRIAMAAECYFGHSMGRSAAAFAYYLMLSFFPLLIVAASILARVNIDGEVLLEAFSAIIPPQVTETLMTFIGYITENYSSAMLWAGIILLISTASGAFSMLMTTMGELYGHKRYSGPLHTVMSFLYSAVFLAIIYLSIVLIATGGWFIGLLDEWFHVGALLADWQWLRFVLLTAILLLFLSILYRSASPRQKPALPILPGAITGAAALLVSSIVFSYVFSASVRYTLVYGSLASVIILMLWLHLLGAVILLGGVVNLLYWQRHAVR